jgi:hypothetical protein
MPVNAAAVCRPFAGPELQGLFLEVDDVFASINGFKRLPE